MTPKIIILDSLSGTFNYSGGNIWANHIANILSGKYSEVYIIREERTTQLYKNINQVELGRRFNPEKTWKPKYFLMRICRNTVLTIREILFFKGPLIIISSSDFPSDVIPAAVTKFLMNQRVIWICITHHLVCVDQKNQKVKLSILEFLYDIWQKIVLKLFNPDQIWTHDKYMAMAVSEICNRDVRHGISGNYGFNEVTIEGHKRMHSHRSIPGQNSLRVNYIGRPSRNKGFLELPEIIKELNQLGYLVELRLFGPINEVDVQGNSWSETISRGNSYQIFNMINSEDFVKQILLSDLTLSPSFGEGWNYSFRESWTLGIPVFAYEITIYKNFAKLAPIFFSSPKSNKELAKKIVAFIQNNENYKNEIMEIRKHIATEDWRKASDLILTFLKSPSLDLKLPE